MAAAKLKLRDGYNVKVYSLVMTTREKIQERIAEMDEAVLPELLEHIDRFEKRRRTLPEEFFSTLDAVHERNKDLSEEEAVALADEAVKWARQTRKP